jgi:hypothetical protein
LRRLVVICLVAVSVAGCGSGGGAAPPPVRLTVANPDLALVRDSSVEIRGTVRPAGAVVTVRGERATVAAGRFTARVDIDPGVNVIDVLAYAGRARPALTAVRVRRITTVKVPDVTGLKTDEARSQLEGLGLKVDVQKDDGFFDSLVGGDRVVCSTDPEAGSRADVGEQVTVVVSRSC